MRALNPVLLLPKASLSALPSGNNLRSGGFVVVVVVVVVVVFKREKRRRHARTYKNKSKTK